MRFSAMAGKAGYLHVAVEVLLIQFVNHLKHLSGDDLFPLVIAGEIALNVAAHAVETGAGDERAHHRPDVLGFDNFQVFRGGHRTSTTAARRRPLLGE